jgi:VCBS repeat-containing protein
MLTNSYQPIATVAAISGKAMVKNREGQVSELQVSDVLLEGETIITKPGNSVELAMNDNGFVRITGGENVLLTADMLASNAPTAEEAAVESSTIERIISALQSDEKIDEVIEAPATGVAPTNDGNSFVRLERILETTGQGFNFETTNSAETLGTIASTSGDDDLIPNFVPVAQNAAESIGEDGVLTGTVIAIDRNHDKLTFSLVGPSPEGLTFNSDGTYTFEPNADYLAVGETTDMVVTYQVDDGKGGTDTATLTITITGENDAPNVSSEINETRSEDDSPFDVALLQNATDPDTGDVLSVANVNTGGAVGITVNANNTITVNPDAYNSLPVGGSAEITITYDVIDDNGGVTPTL